MLSLPMTPSITEQPSKRFKASDVFWMGTTILHSRPVSQPGLSAIYRRFFIVRNPVARELAPAPVRSTGKTRHRGAANARWRQCLGPLRSPAGASSLATIDRGYRCRAWPNARNAASCTASPSVGCAWMVPPMSSSRAPISRLCANAVDNSDTPTPTACQPTIT